MANERAASIHDIPSDQSNLSVKIHFDQNKSQKDINFTISNVPSISLTSQNGHVIAKCKNLIITHNSGGKDTIKQARSAERGKGAGNTGSPAAGVQGEYSCP